MENKHSKLNLPPLSKSLQYFDAHFRQKTLCDDPALLFTMIRVLEISVDAGLTAMILEAGQNPERIQEIYCRYGEFLFNGQGDKLSWGKAGQNGIVAHTEAEWSVLFARDKMMLYDLGFISAKDGDLRKARFLSVPEQTLNLLRWKQFRDQPELLLHNISAVIKRGGPYAKRFCRRLGETLESQPFYFPDNVPPQMQSEHRHFQNFLLNNWASEWMVGTGGSSPAIPPLYTFKNRAMFDLLYALVNKSDRSETLGRFKVLEGMDEASLCMVWRRLGLRRRDTGCWSLVEWERCRRNLAQSKKLIISDRKESHQF